MASKLQELIILVRKQHLSGEVSNTSPEQGNTDSAMQYSYQRSVGCAGRLFCKETFDNESVIWRMMEQQEDMKIPTELLPVCPHCGSPMAMNLRCDDTFVEDEGCHGAAGAFILGI